MISLEPKKKVLRLDNTFENNVKTSDLEELINWGKLNKIQMKKLKGGIDDKTDQREFRAGEKIKKNDDIISIPSVLVISDRNPDLKSLCNKISKISYFRNNYDKICMTVYLLTNTDSNLKPYINFINDNTNFEKFPFFYDEKELKILNGSYFSSLIAGREEAMEFEYKILVDDKIIPKSVSKKDYFKARVNIMSKNYSLKDNKGKDLSVLVPFSDLFNHDTNKANSKFKLNNKGGVELYALHNIKKNDPIYTFYGQFSNYHYLLYYGFVENSNPVPIEVNLELKVKNGNPEKKFQEVLLSPDFDISSTLKNFRSLVANFNLRTVVEKNKKKLHYESPSSLENETESLRLLKVGLKTQISRYPTTVHQDIEKIHSSDDKNIFNLLTVLIEEKKIIIRYYNSALIFYKMLNKLVEIKDKSSHLILTEKISKLIHKKKYLFNYFNIIKQAFDLPIKLNNGETDGVNINVTDNELDIDSEYEKEEDFEDLNVNSYRDHEGISIENDLTKLHDYHSDLHLNQINSSHNYDENLMLNNA